MSIFRKFRKAANDSARAVGNAAKASAGAVYGAGKYSVDKAGDAANAVGDAASTTAGAFADASRYTARKVGNAAVSSYDFVTSTPRMAWELATDMVGRAANIADLRKILTILDYIPFIDDQEVDTETLDKSLMFLQMGNLTIMASYCKKDGVDVDIVRMDKVSARKANENPELGNFTSVVLSETDNPDEPNIHLVINKENFSENHRYLTADLITEALLTPLRRVPVVGDVSATILGYPCRAIARFTINTIYNQANNVAGLFIRDRQEEPEEIVPSLEEQGLDPEPPVVNEDDLADLPPPANDAGKPPAPGA